MPYEKIFKLRSGREIKIIIDDACERDSDVEYEVLIRDPEEKLFRSPIGVNHPQYWKMKHSNKHQAKEIILKYSGTSQRQINQALREFKRIFLYHPPQIGLHYESELH